MRRWRIGTAQAQVVESRHLGGLTAEEIAGAREVHLGISCPLAIEVDSLAYLSLDALNRAVADKNEYCYACYTGDYPTDLVHIEELTAAARDRR
jgi:hypothetical protein